MSKHEEIREVSMPAGKYYLGDPCYLIPDNDWMAWLEAADYTKQLTLVATVPNTDFVAMGFSTAYGDGTYPLTTPNGDEDGFIPVDAGLIGLVPFDSVDKPSYYDGSYRVVEFDSDIVCTVDQGILDFGGYVVDTDPEASDDWYDDEED